MRWDKHYFAFVLILVPLSVFPLARPSSFSVDTKLDAKFAQIPMAFSGWRGTDHAVDERTYEILETRNVLSRLYTNSAGKTIHLLLVSSEKDRRVAHPPEVCYLSSHYTIMDEHEETINVAGRGFEVKKFIARSEKIPSYQEEVLYVYKVGDRFTTNYYAQQFQFAFDRLSRGNSRVLLIRLAGAEKTTLQKFFSDFLPHIS